MLASPDALANFSLLCLLPGPRDGQRVVLTVAPQSDGPLAHCPCCWRLDALQRAILKQRATPADAQAPTAIAVGAKALQRASRWTKCRLWRRFA